MTPELKKKWLDALRSGNYQQGQGQLRLEDKNKYCCLGVLCDVAGYEWNGNSCKAGSDYIKNKDEMKVLGLDESIHEDCYNMNDGINEDEKFFTFSEIADYLEKNL